MTVTTTSPLHDIETNMEKQPCTNEEENENENEKEKEEEDRCVYERMCIVRLLLLSAGIVLGMYLMLL